MWSHMYPLNKYSVNIIVNKGRNWVLIFAVFEEAMTATWP